MKIAWIYLDKRGAAIDALKDFAAMQYIIQNQTDIEEEMREKLFQFPTSTPSGMPHHPNPHAFEARLASSFDEIDVLKERYRQALEYMEWFRPAWEELTHDEQFVLNAFYIADEQQDVIGLISEQFQIERSSAYKKKNRALAKLTTLLYGK
ncbi:hypothetical protein LJC74_09880 [Eubacteriales bacterium OttesenSCG-928-A19]|nr:hypothetical protein [Eubacteriales bacterium OttesenSCG-928-A19]